MPRTKIEYDNYKIKAFLDTNIILEGRPLAELPWHEIDTEGPIIVLLTPTALKEVDSKKHDGRIGKHAREFNRTIASVAVGGAPLVIRDRKPRVELALANATRIPWNLHDDLDPDDGDSCIIAEILYAKNMSPTGKILVSQDIKPIAFAANYDLEARHVSASWLRQMQPGPADKEIQRLKSKLTDYETNEPKFDIKLEILDDEPISIIRLQDLTDIERFRITRKIFNQNPKQDQLRGNRPFDHPSFHDTYDSSYNERYEDYTKKIPIFMANYERRLEHFLNQIRFRLVVSNTGKKQANNMLVEISTSNGWLHDRYIFSSPSGPIAPKPKSYNPLFNYTDFTRIPPIPPHVGRHDMEFKDEPNCKPHLSVICEDFRHGQDWIYNGVVGIDPRSPETEIIVSITASNFCGKAQNSRVIKSNVQTVHIYQIIDENTLELIIDTPIDDVVKHKTYDKYIDFSIFPDDHSLNKKSGHSD